MFNPLTEALYETKSLISRSGDFPPHFRHKTLCEVAFVSRTVTSFFLEETNAAIGTQSKYLLQSPIGGAV